MRMGRGLQGLGSHGPPLTSKSLRRSRVRKNLKDVPSVPPLPYHRVGSGQGSSPELMALWCPPGASQLAAQHDSTS